MSDPLLDSPLVLSIGWALVHFIWQGTLIGGATALVLRAMREAPAAKRYLVACVSLALMLLAPLATVVTNGSVDSIAVVSVAAMEGDVILTNRVLPMAVVVWMLGVVVLSIRLAAACLGIERLKRATREVDEAVSARLSTLATRLGIERSVRVFESTIVRVPTVVGTVRPVILLPASVITGLPAAHLDAVLAHELAHVRRHDYLVNALQAIVETLLFYHPAVWWCSRQIRIEREHCCDDMVVEVFGDRVGYATALAQLEQLRGLEPMLSLTATGGRLIDRIRRVLGYAPVNERGSMAWMILPTLTLVVLGIVVAPVLTLADADGAVASQTDITLQEQPPDATTAASSTAGTIAASAPGSGSSACTARTSCAAAPPAPPALPALGTLPELPALPEPPDPPAPPDPPQSPEDVSGGCA